MKFRRLVEEVEFRDVKINSNGDIIDIDTGAVIGTTNDQIKGSTGGSAEGDNENEAESEEDAEGKKGKKGEGKGKGKKIPLDGKLYHDPNHGGIYKTRSKDPVYIDAEDPYAYFETGLTDGDEDEYFDRGL